MDAYNAAEAVAHTDAEASDDVECVDSEEKSEE